jgi:hypothetical protein
MQRRWSDERDSDERDSDSLSINISSYYPIQVVSDLINPIPVVSMTVTYTTTYAVVIIHHYKHLSIKAK